MINLCTPKVTNKMQLTIRNAKAIIFTLYNLYQDWMTE